ncbi:MAG TPA: hypothetical protein VM935_18000 [Chitinophagaceae bacterium]|jgi:hypothetical protein|nr:hypothetical protein [Chitinophagaceae bacterium]
MNNIDALLKNANLYSIEYCGYYILRFTISNGSAFYHKFENIEIEFISGCSIVDVNITRELGSEDIFRLYGANVLSTKFEENYQLNIWFDNSCKVVSTLEEDVLCDRNWVITPVNNKESYILSDFSEIFYSDNMKDLIMP